jgi:hypothetical protein
MGALDPWIRRVSEPARRRRQRMRVLRIAVLVTVVLPIIVYALAYAARLGWGR